MRLFGRLRQKDKRSSFGLIPDSFCIMISVIQRVSNASVRIDHKLKSEIGQGLMLLLGIAHKDTLEDVTWLSQKVVNMRIFGDSDGKMNLSVKDLNGDILVVSQFTLHANTKKGNRPSFIEAARPEVAIPLYKAFIKQIEIDLGKKVSTGEFGADMQISLINDGPVTIIVDTKSK
jgi:D-tyrosyl-tRNA(Tyr) deacylase